MAEPRTAEEMFFRRVRAIARHLADADCPPREIQATNVEDCSQCDTCPLHVKPGEQWFHGCASLELGRLTGISGNDNWGDEQS